MLPIDAGRQFFFLFLYLFSIGHTTENFTLLSPFTLLYGVLLGTSLTLLLIFCENAFRTTKLIELNAFILGLGCGHLLAQPLLKVLAMILPHNSAYHFLATTFYLFCLYLTAAVFIRHSNALFLHLPFIRFKSEQPLRHDLVVTRSILEEGRLIEWAKTGLLNDRLLIPKRLVLQLERSSHPKSVEAYTHYQQLMQLPMLNSQLVSSPLEQETSLSYEKIAQWYNAAILVANTSEASSTQCRVVNVQGLITQTSHLTIKITENKGRDGLGKLASGIPITVRNGARYTGKHLPIAITQCSDTMLYAIPIPTSAR